jgi:hypothetical protein
MGPHGRPRHRHLRRHVCRQRARPGLSRRGVRAGDGRPRQGQHHQHQQHGRPSRPTRRCGLWGHQGRPRVVDSGLDGRVQPPRRQGERRRPRARCIHDRRHASCSTPSEPPRHSTAPPNPRKSPRSSHSWPHPAPATSPARSSRWMGAAPRSDGEGSEARQRPLQPDSALGSVRA